VLPQVCGEDFGCQLSAMRGQLSVAEGGCLMLVA
jgi:hypothetical protein